MQCDHFVDIAIKDAHRQGQTGLPDIIAAEYQMRPDMFEAFYQVFPELSDVKPHVKGVENAPRGKSACNT